MENAENKYQTVKGRSTWNYKIENILGTCEAVIGS